MEKTSMKKNEPQIGRTIWDDLQRGDFKKTLKRDYEDLKEFFLDDERRISLNDMNWFKRGLFMSWWLLKSLFFNLTPMRRLLFVIAVLLILLSRQMISFTTGSVQTETNFHFSILGGLFLIFILMLELKDKLLAKSELNEGRSIQFALMPEESPLIPNWDVWLFSRPANDVGGDLVDYVAIDSKSYGLTLADVSGKGLGAALFMAKLQATVRALAPDYSTLNAFAEKLNSIFYRDTISNKFASLIYIDLKIDSPEIHLINAGHFPPIILQNGSLQELTKGDPALGLSPKSTYREQTVDFKAIDLLLVYSDGLTEAKNINGDFFGEQRLKESLFRNRFYPAESIGKKILSEIDLFVGEAKTTDDMSMIIIKHKKS